MRQAIAFIILVTILLLPVEAFAVSDHLEYNIKVNNDGSASWKIIQVTDIDFPVDSWEDFEQRLLSTIDTAKNSTARGMALDWSSLEMSTEIHWETSSKTIEYVFRWQNFSIVEQGQIRFGDIFSKSFFSLLYGDGELYLTYPGDYVLSSVSPSPDQRDDSTQTLYWYRTQDFSVGDQSILLAAIDGGSNENYLPFGVTVLGSGGLGAVAIGFIILKQRRRRKEKLPRLDAPPSWQEVESDEEKILKLLQSSGGNLKQSEICDKLRFSRAKTSLLLAEMEKNSLVGRRKKGKNKIVFPIESEEGRKL